MSRRPPRTYNIHQAKTHLSRLLEQMESGEDIVIARAGVPVARLVPVTLNSKARPLGTEAGRLIASDDFDAPLSADVLDSFES